MKAQVKLPGAVLTGLLFLVCGTIEALPAAAQRPGPPATAGAPKLAATPAGAIYGSYLFVSESSGKVASKGAEIILKFTPPNVVSLRATMPGETLTDAGTFEISGDRMSITLRDTGKGARNAAYQLTPAQLVVPVLMLGDGEGRSTWTRINDPSDPLTAAVDRYFALVNQQGRKAALESTCQFLRQQPSVKSAEVSNEKILSVTYTSGYREFFLAPPAPISPPQSGRVKQGAALRSAVLPWARVDEETERIPVQFLPGRGSPALNPKARFDAWLKNEPEPVSHGDAPASKTALILSAYHSLPVLIPGGGAGDKFNTFAEMGEDLAQIGSCLTRAGYIVEGPHIDKAVTVCKLFELLHDRPWGVIYFNTHGGVFGEQDVLLSTGDEVPPASRATAEKRQKYLDRCLQPCLDLLRKNAKPGTGAGWAERLKQSVVVGMVYGDIPFVSITSDFFACAGANFSSSLVFLNGCETAKSVRLRETLKARSFVGWREEVQMELAAAVNEPFWRCLSLKTRSDREAMDFALNYLLEAKGFGEKLKTYGAMWNPNNLGVFRQGKGDPEKPFVAAQRRMLMTVRDYAFRKKANGQPEDLAGMVAQLYKCNEENKGTGLAANPFCRDALVGEKVPTTVIDEVKGELCGFGGSPTRFTLIEAR